MRPRDPRHQGDRGVLLCLNEADGSLAWQLVVPKLVEDIYLDWPEVGMCSPPTVEGDRVYTLTNRDEVVCLDLHGMANGNDGPFRDEGRHMAPPEQPPMTVGPTDADILWLLDLRSAAGVHPHDSTHGSILFDGRIPLREHQQRAEQQAQCRSRAQSPEPGGGRQGHRPVDRTGA